MADSQSRAEQAGSEAAGFTATDHAMMARALRLAERGAYTTRPNPMVGCVIAEGDTVLGEGWHQRAGGPHAEVFALQAAGERARGATAYVTLEPCAHHGRTPPCCDALVEAGVARVVAAMRDPFAQVDGAGFERLRAAGIAVAHGLLEADARRLNRGYLSRLERGRPWVRVKLATSLDGRTALANKDSKWISGEAARRDVMHWRARAGAILTGAGTVLADDPRLTVRFDDGGTAPDGSAPDGSASGESPSGESPSAGSPAFVPPLRVVLDPGLATVARDHVRAGDAPTLYFHAPDAKVPRGFTASHAVAPMRGGQLDLAAVLKRLAELDVNEVQVEAGATLAGALLRDGLVDEVLLYMAPLLLGAEARPLFDGLRIDAMAQRMALVLVETRMIGDDLRLLLRPEQAG